MTASITIVFLFDELLTNEHFAPTWPFNCLRVVKATAIGVSAFGLHHVKRGRSTWKPPRHNVVLKCKRGNTPKSTRQTN